MSIEKRMIAGMDENFNPIEREIFVETKTEIVEMHWSKDLIESQIVQKQNLIDNTQLEIQELQAKLDQINNLSNK
jgi:hypothetical protein